MTISTAKATKTATEKFYSVKAKMMTNWKVVADGVITNESTPQEIFAYACQMECEIWIQMDLMPLITEWSMQYENTGDFDKTKAAFNNYFA